MFLIFVNQINVFYNNLIIVNAIVIKDNIKKCYKLCFMLETMILVVFVLVIF